MRGLLGLGLGITCPRQKVFLISGPRGTMGVRGQSPRNIIRPNPWGCAALESYLATGPLRGRRRLQIPPDLAPPLALCPPARAPTYK